MDIRGSVHNNTHIKLFSWQQEPPLCPQ